MPEMGLDQAEKRRIYMREYARARRLTDPLFVKAQRIAGRKSRLNRLEKTKVECNDWRNKNKEKISVYNNEYFIAKKIEIQAKRSINYKKRRKVDPIFNLKSRERNRIWSALNGKIKTAKSENLLGCSYEYLKKHIESLFIDGMTWDNMSEWHIDHIKPLASFDLNDIEQQKLAFHYTNLQPLWAMDNMKKGAKYA